MKGWSLQGINDFTWKELEKPVIREKEVLVKMHACGICGSDIPRVYRDGAHNMPLVIGHEFSGEVVHQGDEVTEAWTGKRVGIFPLIPCGKCVPCQKKLYEMCRSYSYLGSRCDGGFAEYVAVPEWNLIELPEKVTYEQAAMLEPMAVAVHAMRRVSPKEDDTVVVCGLGTIGMLLVMFLQERGIKKLLVVGNKESQKQVILKLGIDVGCFCDTRVEKPDEWILSHTNGNGADIFFECVGKQDTYSQAVELTAPAGKVCLVGNPYSDMALDKAVYWKILRNQLELHGTWNSSFTHEADDDWHYVLKCLKEGKIHPEVFISHRYGLEDIVQGFEIMRDKSEDYIKIICNH